MRIVRNIFFGFWVFVAVGLIGFTFWLHDRYVVPILMYHHVGRPMVSKWRLNTITEKSFDDQMNFIRRHGFRVISFDDLIEGMKKGQQFAHNTVVIQFDDGYENNYLNAYPILKKYGFPATIFLISSMVDHYGFLTWDQIREMEQNNISFGAHTRHHLYLPKLGPAEAQEEIAGSKQDIESHLGHVIKFFCYPVGGFTPQIKRMVHDDGFEAAVTTNRGKDRFNVDLYELKRIHMNNSDDHYSGLIMWFKLSGFYNSFRKAKYGAEPSQIKVAYD